MLAPDVDMCDFGPALLPWSLTSTFSVTIRFAFLEFPLSDYDGSSGLCAESGNTDGMIQVEFKGKCVYPIEI